ncbi:MAG: hypothetical protein LBF84_03910 [Holosporales bacterium]|nr:hypothetical protein [Holosporales bacterium]
MRGRGNGSSVGVAGGPGVYGQYIWAVDLERSGLRPDLMAAPEDLALARRTGWTSYSLLTQIAIVGMAALFGYCGFLLIWRYFWRPIIEQ